MTLKSTGLMPTEMTHSQRRNGLFRCRDRGFALVVTLSLMILLTVIAVGLLTLSSVSLRSSNQSQAQATARANARLALALAIGELQKQTGTDTRVTARADILKPENPPVLGVWKSWQGDDHTTTGTYAGRPVSPGDYPAAKKARFLTWLVSGDPAVPADFDKPPDTAPSTPDKPKVTLVGTGALGNAAARAKLQIHLTATTVTTNSQQGGLAWWIGGENQKARVPRPYQPDPASSAARWAGQNKSYPVADPKPFRLEPVLDDPKSADKAITLNQADLIASDSSNKTSREFFHDLSAVSIGLLTNTATGGWRKDLSLVTENWSAQPESGLPLFRLTPESNTQATRPTTKSPVPAGAMLYPWATYRGSSVPTYLSATVCSWENLANYATLYKKMTTTSGRPSIPIHAFSTWTYKPARPDVFYRYLHEVRILPRVARMQWVFSHSASAKNINGIAMPTGKLEPRLLVTPVITMWNPYNVEITSPPLQFIIGAPLPVALNYSINGASGIYSSLMAGELINYPNAPLGARTLDYQIKKEFTLKPGETRIFSPAANNQLPSNRGLLPGNIIQNTVVPLELIPGVHNGGGDIFPIKGSTGNTLALAPTSNIKADVKFDNTFNWRASSPTAPNPVAGFAFNMTLYDVVTNHSTYPDGLQVTWYQMLYPQAIANAIYPPPQGLAACSLEQCLGNPMPFLSTVFGARMASRTNLPSKGFVQSSLFANYSAMGADKITYGYDYPGTKHPVNSPYDFSFIKHPSGGDSQLPNASDTTNRGYIVTGFNSADGLSRCVIDELPTRPLVSLGELTHWDLRFENAFPPYAFNLIGNSDASPLFPPNAVVNDKEKGSQTNPQHDDSYCANHLLFDDWFVSSIAPDPTDFGGKIVRDQKTTYIDFVKGTKPLANRVYQPIPADQAAAATNATQLHTDHVAKTDSWKTIASRLEVDGMFNVNSTSVTAWRALLGHCRKQRIPYVRETATSWDTALSGETDHAFSRFSVAGDTETGKPGSSGDFPDATEFTGYRVLEDKFLDSLATEVVNQVRLRGPFLSLAEFVNRQLSSGNLALAGAIQSALNEVVKSNNPTKVMESWSKPTDPNLPPVASNTPEYQFPAAAAGYSTYGLPGWTRQADILRPLAPILSVRDDTFTIRAYGDARDAQGRILAHVVCEAVVRRTRDFSDPSDAPDILTPPTIPANKTFGRHFQLVSFRWLNADEV